MVIKLELNPMDTNFVSMVKVIVTEEAWRYSDEFKAIAVEEMRKCLNQLRSKATMTSRRMEIKSEGESFDLNVNSMVREMLTYEMPVLLDVLHGMKVEEMQRRFRQLLQSSAQNGSKGGLKGKAMGDAWSQINFRPYPTRKQKNNGRSFLRPEDVGVDV